MAKSHTQRKSITKEKAEQAAQAGVAVEVFTRYVKRWSKAEANKILSAEPVIIPAKWGLQVGKYAIKNLTETWHVYNNFNELVNAFTSKKSAVVYTILLQKGRYNQADNLYKQDTRLSKLAQDRTCYIHSRLQAVKRKDTFLIDVLDARITDNAIMLNSAKIDLEKTLNQAKYLKGIWEKPL